jgi:hypothetical protein
VGRITRRVAHRLANVILRPVRALAFRIARAVATRRISHGVEIVDPSAGGGESIHLMRVEEALGLIAESSPAVLMRIQRYVRAIGVAPTGPGFVPDNGYCLLHYRDLDALASDRIALQLAHEAAHARLHRSGFSYKTEERDRIERACMNAELRMARRLPNSITLREVIDRQSKTPWWSDEDIARRKEQMWIDAGVPVRMWSLLKRFFV